MNVTVYSIEGAQTRDAAHTADVAARSGKVLSQQAGDAREQAEWSANEQWIGPAADAPTHRLDASLNQLDVLGVSAQSVSIVAGAYIQILQLAQGVVSAALSTARAVFMPVTPAGHVSAHALAWIPGLGMSAQAMAETLTRILTSAVALVRALDSGSGGAVSALASVTNTMPVTRKLPPVPAGTTAAMSREAADSPQVTRLETATGPVFVVGDVDAAESITTFVSGVGSSSEGAMHNTSQWAIQEVERARAEGKNIAVVAWHGYRAPENLVGAIGSSAAHKAAPDLRAFQRGLRERNPEAKLNVVGYSYGSVVVGTAATQDGPGLEADDVTFVGSPGVGAHSADDLRLNSEEPNSAGPAHVESHHVPGDLIQLATGPEFGAHGPDPSSPDFGTEGAPGWSEYRWKRLMDLYILGRGDTDTHSSYLWDPALDLTSGRQ